MKHALLLVVLFSATPSPAQPEGSVLRPHVDTRVELLSIAARMAGIKGFDDNLNPVYAKAIDAYFGAHRDHPLIRRLRELKPELDEAYWEIPALAVHLGPPPKLEPLTTFDDTADVDDWESRKLFDAGFVALVQRFYREAKAGAFFDSQKSYYGAVEREYETRGVYVNEAWFGAFFGLKATEEYFPIVALGMRNGAYMRVNFPRNHRHTVPLYETMSFDDRGVPTTFTAEVYPRMMVHEYIHAFTNQLVDANSRELRSSAETLLKNPKVHAAVEKTFYDNWQYLLYESLVRACSIKYVRANGGFGQGVEQEILAQEKAGFFWIRGLIDELDEYEARRDRYRNLEQFMPRIIAFFAKTANEIETRGGISSQPMLSSPSRASVSPR